MSKTAKKYVDFFVQVVSAMVIAEIEQIFYHIDYGTIVAVILGSLGLLQALDLKYKVKND